MASSVSFTSSTGTDPVRALDLFLAGTVNPSREAMEYAGQREITRIRTRTMAGTDVNGSPFAPYSPAYAKRRAKKGRSIAPVNLLMTGIMQTSLTVEIRGPKSFAIVEMNEEAKAYGRAHNEGAPSRGLPQRRWFDTSPAELGEMTKDLLSFGSEGFVQTIG
jgi:hypothetical protein